MLARKETKLIKLIKFTPIIIVGIICATITSLLYIDKNLTLERDLKQLKESYLEKNKIIIKSEVEKIYDYISYEKENSENKLKEEIKNRVFEAYDLMTYIYNKYKDTETKEQITQRIKDSLVSFKFNEGRGYFYINSMDGINILHPLKPELENRNLLNYSNASGEKIVQNVIKSLENKNESYNYLSWEKPKNPNKEYKKITFNKIFEPYNWFIGTGEYLEDFEEKIKEQILSYIGTIRYSKNGYILVVDGKGVYLSHIAKNYIGLNRIDLQDANGFMITKEIINQAKLGDGFLKYVGTIKPETHLPSEKITYVKGFKDWDWAIATGFYTDELEKQILDKEKEFKNNYIHNLIQLFLISGILTILFLFLSFYISGKLEKRFLKYRQRVVNHIKKDKEKDAILSQQSKMAAMGEMLENIAHQWRQPLSTISTMSTGIKIQYEYGQVEKQEILNSLEAISTTTKYLSQTIDDFRDYFNPNKEACHFNLKNIFEKAFDLMEIQFNLKHIKIVRNITKDIYIYGYENEFLQVIINILSNSKDQFEIISQGNDKYIFINIYEEKNSIRIEIFDNAGGIDEKILDKVFEPYFTTKYKSKGTGIGLYMSKKIIENHMKGKLLATNKEFQYENNTHKGALFEITFFIEDEKTI